jgi:hypothetical protein
MYGTMNIKLASYIGKRKRCVKLLIVGPSKWCFGVRWPTNAQGRCKFLLYIPNLPHVSASDCHLQGATRALKLLQYCLCFGQDVDYGSFGVASCRGCLWRWRSLAETCRGKIGMYNKNLQHPSAFVKFVFLKASPHLFRRTRVHNFGRWIICTKNSYKI